MTWMPHQKRPRVPLRDVEPLPGTARSSSCARSRACWTTSRARHPSPSSPRPCFADSGAGTLIRRDYKLFTQGPIGAAERTACVGSSSVTPDALSYRQYVVLNKLKRTPYTIYGGDVLAIVGQPDGEVPMLMKIPASFVSELAAISASALKMKGASIDGVCSRYSCCSCLRTIECVREAAIRMCRSVGFLRNSRECYVSSIRLELGTY
ncbi:hypothetical protein DFH11DRAFT_1614267 [Phellopilus nigrolimitatus]|nr:hypothetical protein DFH11DRAFT_1614267 [Phellopilus nigrolimitatus]